MMKLRRGQGERSGAASALPGATDYANTPVVGNGTDISYNARTIVHKSYKRSKQRVQYSLFLACNPVPPTHGRPLGNAPSGKKFGGALLCHARRARAQPAFARALRGEPGASDAAVLILP